MNLIERLRGMVQKIRRTPMPIADVVPMLQEAADEIERLTAELARAKEYHAAELADVVAERDALKLIANEHRDGRLANAEIVAALTAELARAKRDEKDAEPVAIPDCGEAGHAEGCCGNLFCLPRKRTIHDDTALLRQALEALEATAKPMSPVIKKFGAIYEQDGDILMTDFHIDCLGMTMTPIEAVVRAVIARLEEELSKGESHV